MIELSNRLKAVADMVTIGSVVCDAGCDHGYVSIYLVQKNICPHVIAMDINQGPLLQAREHIADYGVDAYIETRLSDGVEKLLPGEADCLILAGMGGRLMMKILAEGKEKTDAMKELILQPQSEIGAVRQFLSKENWHICQENMVYEDGKYYPMMKVTQVSCEAMGNVARKSDAPHGGTETDSQQDDIFIRQAAYDRYGRLLLEERHPVLHRFLQWEQEQSRKIRKALEAQDSADAEKDARIQQRLETLKKDTLIREFALSFYAEEKQDAM